MLLPMNKPSPPPPIHPKRQDDLSFLASEAVLRAMARRLGQDESGAGRIAARPGC